MRIKKYGKKEEYASIDFVYTKYIQNRLVVKSPHTLLFVLIKKPNRFAHHNEQKSLKKNFLLSFLKNQIESFSWLIKIDFENYHRQKIFLGREKLFWKIFKRKKIFFLFRVRAKNFFLLLLEK